jgi:hypothetical protein
MQFCLGNSNRFAIFFHLSYLVSAPFFNRRNMHAGEDTMDTWRQQFASNGYDIFCKKPAKIRQVYFVSLRMPIGAS